MRVGCSNRKKNLDCRAVQRSASCRSRRELSNEYLLSLAKFGFDTAENEPCKVCPFSAYRSPRFRYYRLLPSSSVALQQMLQFASDAGWTHLAVVYVGTDSWAKALVNEMSVENFQLTLFPVSEQEDPSADRQMAAALRDSGCRVVVSFVWQRPGSIFNILRAEGLLTDGWAYLSTDETEYRYETEAGVFFGSLARDFQEAPLAALQDEWAATMPTFIGMPLSVPVTAKERKELTSSMLQTSCYDSVVA